MSRITSQLRTADAVAPDALADECTLITAAGDDITYRYSSGDNKLYLITNYDLSDDDYVLCDNVTAMTFTKNTVTEDSVTYVKSVQISMTVVSGDVEKTVSARATLKTAKGTTISRAPGSKWCATSGSLPRR